MEKIKFEITSEEIKKISNRKLNKKQIKNILVAVENDIVLWGNIETSIKDAINQSFRRPNRG